MPQKLEYVRGQGEMVVDDPYREQLKEEEET